MLSDYFSEINDHGTVVPVKDLAAFPRSEQAVLGASWNELDVTASGKTENGVTFTINADKSITFVTEAGGATADTSIAFNPDYQITDANTHYYSGVTSGAAEKYYLECYYRDNSNTYKGNTRVYDGVVPINVSDKTGATKINTFIFMVKSGFISTTPITVYPMVAPKADALYAPYAMTNRELTEKVTTWNTATLGTPSSGTLIDTNNNSFCKYDEKTIALKLQINNCSANTTINIGVNPGSANCALVGFDANDANFSTIPCKLDGALLTILKAASVFRLCVTIPRI